MNLQTYELNFDLWVLFRAIITLLRNQCTFKNKEVKSILSFQTKNVKNIATLHRNSMFLKKRVIEK